ncbi:hypothetical protein CP970_26200 [Streptomyces kanamyceticus]|uniref:Uncharacterized protein n=1 Tax=Streptomyces kanamyceticus TaxID=1967 RepID=A0A5J6GFN4_STRKN|nr:hypothetical protein [Streptomyces kanamyceticus]QEU93933.1 hypothetical protein CP970_26200 [Streptomyces kanamyceticus]
MLRRLLARFLPGTGTRRARVAEAEEPPPRGPRSGPRAPTRLPRSPYAREAAENRPVDVSGSPLARPYCRAAERRLLQAERRLALVLALEGVDYGPDVIRGVTLPGWPDRPGGRGVALVQEALEV